MEHIVNISAAKLALRKSWKEEANESIKKKMVALLILDAQYHHSGYGARPKYEPVDA